MIRVSKIIGLVSVVILLLVCLSILFFLFRGGAFRETVNKSPGNCQLISTGHGSAEDIAIDHQEGIAYLSALDRRGLVEGKAVTGTILKLDLSNTDLPPVTAIEKNLDGFRPHGISLFTHENGDRTLFVINHSGGVDERIEIFFKRVGEEQFSHIETLTDPLITHPNDLVAVSERKFYIANDSGAANVMERIGEMLFGIGLSPLVFFDGVKFSIVADGLRSSGGINADKNKGKLYVGETMGKAIRVYNLTENGSLLDLKTEIQLNNLVDNIDLDANSDLWIANHTNTLSFIRHINDVKSPAPSQVQRISVRNGHFGPPQTVFENDGRLFSASSVGGRYKGLLLVGSITEPNILVCELD